MHWMFLAVLLPHLYWDESVETVSALQRAGVDCVYVPAGAATAWKKARFCHVPSGPEGWKKAVAPGVRWEMDVASATRAPWVDANGWRFRRLRQRHGYYYDLPVGSAALAAAEAFAYQAEAYVRIAPADLESYGQMLAFLKSLTPVLVRDMANIGVVDDGSAVVGEVLNLLSRRNLLFRAVSAADPNLDLNVRIGSQEYPKAEAANPSQFAEKIRRRLGDEKRLLRIYGSDVVIGRLTGDRRQARLHLLNYGKEKVEGLRVRVLGSYARGKLQAAEKHGAALEDYAVREGATEFTVPEMGVYAVVDLSTEPRP